LCLLVDHLLLGFLQSSPDASEVLAGAAVAVQLLHHRQPLFVKDALDDGTMAVVTAGRILQQVVEEGGRLVNVDVLGHGRRLRRQGELRRFSLYPSSRIRRKIALVGWGPFRGDFADCTLALILPLCYHQATCSTPRPMPRRSPATTT
jgi:hypothetical protein